MKMRYVAFETKQQLSELILSRVGPELTDRIWEDLKADKITDELVSILLLSTYPNIEKFVQFYDMLVED